MGISVHADEDVGAPAHWVIVLALPISQPRIGVQIVQAHGVICQQ
jgi:hypothetical protein